MKPQCSKCISRSLASFSIVSVLFFLSILICRAGAAGLDLLPDSFENIQPVFKTPSSGAAKPADSLNKATRKKAFWVGLQFGAQFAEFEGQKHLNEDLNFMIEQKFQKDTSVSGTDTNIAVTRSIIQQAYDPVQIIFPLGIVAGVSLFANLDLQAELQAFWFEQKSIVQESPNRNNNDPAVTRSVEYKYGMRAYLAGIGLKYYFPVQFISVNKGQFLYISYSNYWNLDSEFYNYGNAKGTRSPWGVGYETSIGYHLANSAKFRILGQITFSSFDFDTGENWSRIVRDVNEADMVWSLNSLKFNFQFVVPLFFYR